MMEIKLRPGERLDDLQRSGYKIIQNEKLFCFGMDAVLLSAFAQVKEGEHVLDLGTGTGVIPILLEARTAGASFAGLEICKDGAEMAARSVQYNRLEEKISIVQGDIREADRIFPAASFDVVTSNPPYMTANHGLVNSDMNKAAARHEILCTLEDVAAQAARALMPPHGGDHPYLEPIQAGTEAHPSGLSICGQRTQYDFDRGIKGRQTKGHRGACADRVSGTGNIYG